MSKAHPPKNYTFVASKGSFQKVNTKNIWNFPREKNKMSENAYNNFKCILVSCRKHMEKMIPPDPPPLTNGKFDMFFAFTF